MTKIRTTMKAISTTNAPKAIGPYSQAIQVGNFIFTSGQIPIDPSTGTIVDGGIKAQARQSLQNIKAIMESILGIHLPLNTVNFMIFQQNWTMQLCTMGIFS